MYVELLIQDILVKFVVNTGATLTLVSTKVYDLIPDLYRPHLNATKSQIKSACGNYLNLRGKGNFKLDFGTERFTSEAEVTELQVDGILGLDFMKNKNVSKNLLRYQLDQIVVTGKVCLSEGQTLPTNDVLVEASYDLNEEVGDESKDFIDDEDKDFIDDEEASSENENEDFSDDEDSDYSEEDTDD
ncbi:unnamed protein product [Mytilus edulis]|uniref:Peptidase A2 domain-containing protein n=1 Tax=Mytilus edulis TaxID=6550 RepID=A0A8S3RGF8_MYTED|nr:unnamed protein product [Mytilus edulis]